MAQISTATDQLQTAQSQADKTANLAGEITERMATEVREFTAFMQKANDGEKSTLRLEVEKLRRAEQEWLGVAVYAGSYFVLNKAADGLGQENPSTTGAFPEHLSRDAARRVGLVAVTARRVRRSRRNGINCPEGAVAAAGAVIEEVMASGYSFQGKLLRPVLVKLQKARRWPGGIQQSE